MSNPGLIKSYKSGAKIAARRVVAFNADGAVVHAAANSAPIGISDLGADGAGKTADVILSGLADVEYGGVVSQGDALTADAGGKVIVAAPAANTTVWIIGQAMTGGVAGDIGLVHISKSRLKA